MRVKSPSAGVLGPAVSLSLSVFHGPPELEEFSVDPESSCPISDLGEGPWNLLVNKVSSCPSASGSWETLFSIASEVPQNFSLSEASSSFPPFCTCFSSSPVEVFSFPLTSTTDVQCVIDGFYSLPRILQTRTRYDMKMSLEF